MFSNNNAILFTLILSFAVASIACLPFGNTRIAFGKEATIGQFPYQVALHRRDAFTCGGSILSERFVLTAGHCIGKENVESPKYFQVSVGRSDRTIGKLHELKRLYLHENYSVDNPLTTSNNDIALLELKTPIVFSKNVAPIQLNRAFIPENVEAVVSGYGDTETSMGFSNLRYVHLNTVSTCTPFTVRSNTTLCAQSVTKGGSCFGDSGGPLAYNNTLIGIVSFAPEPCGRKGPSAFTRVSQFVDWVEKTVQNAVDN